MATKSPRGLGCQPSWRRWQGSILGLSAKEGGTVICQLGRSPLALNRPTWLYRVESRFVRLFKEMGRGGVPPWAKSLRYLGVGPRGLGLAQHPHQSRARGQQEGVPYRWQASVDAGDGDGDGGVGFNPSKLRPFYMFPVWSVSA